MNGEGEHKPSPHRQEESISAHEVNAKGSVTIARTVYLNHPSEMPQTKNTVPHQPSPPSDPWDRLRLIYSFLTQVALVWVAIRLFWDFEHIPPEQRLAVLIANAWMLIPVGILSMPVVLTSGALGTCLMNVRSVLSPEHIGNVSMISLLTCVALAIFWIVAAEVASRRIIAVGIKVALGAAAGAAAEHRRRPQHEFDLQRPWEDETDDH